MDYYDIGNSMDSETDLSTSDLPSTLDNSCLSVDGCLYVDENFTIKNSHVIMNRGAEIVVEGKYLLQLEGQPHRRLRAYVEGHHRIWET